MLPIAGQPAGPIGLTFLETLMGGRGVSKAKKTRNFLFNFFFFHGQRRALQLVSINFPVINS